VDQVIAVIVGGGAGGSYLSNADFHGFGGDIVIEAISVTPGQVLTATAVGTGGAGGSTGAAGGNTTFAGFTANGGGPGTWSFQGTSGDCTTSALGITAPGGQQLGAGGQGSGSGGPGGVIVYW
jgi:hypothetical protein